jgi:L-ascorbate metabolism protein UlaG (beta-lactamase superfamily)
MHAKHLAAKQAEAKKETVQTEEEWGFEQAIIGPVGSLGFLQLSNNDRVIAAQKYGGVREDTGEVEISFFGMCAFKITSPKGLEIVIDPWRNAPGFGGYWFLVDFPITKCDIGLCTHAHGDHDAVHRLDAAMILERMGGTFELGDVKITGILDKHMCEPQNDLYTSEMMMQLFGKKTCPPGEHMEWCNTMFLIEVGGLRILHWGDNRQNPPEDVWDMMKDIDIAMLPVSDDGHIMTPRWGKEIAEKLNAKVVIPHHYYIEGLNTPNAGWELSAEQFTRMLDHTFLDTHTIKLSPKKIKNYKQHVMYFGEHTLVDIYKWEAPTYEVKNVPLPEPVKAWERFKPKNGDKY